MLIKKIKFAHFSKILRFHSKSKYNVNIESILTAFQKVSSNNLCVHNSDIFHSKEEWRRYKFHGYGKDLISIFSYIPVYILLAIFGIQEVLCEEEEQEVLQLTESSKVDALHTSPENDKNQFNNQSKTIAQENEIGKEFKKLDKPGFKTEDKKEKLNNETSDIDINDQEGKESDSDIKPSDSNDKHSVPNDPRPLPNFRTYSDDEFISIKRAIDMARNLVHMNKAETGGPGISVAVSLNGKIIWAEGIGYSDLENGARMSPYTVLRIASISKSITMAVVGKLIEEGKLDLDAPIQKYIPSFPKKMVNGEEVTITTRHLLNHTSGIRHYKLKEEVNHKANDKKKAEEVKAPITMSKKNNGKKIGNVEVENKGEENGDRPMSVESKRERIRKLVAEKLFKPKKKSNDEFDLEEYYIKEEFETIDEALQLFKDDDLLFKPGEKYYYTTHGYTLVSAIVEAVAERPFSKIMIELFEDLAMKSTYLDRNDPIIYRRGRHYVRNKNGLLENAPYVDNSYKWAGGGFLSNVVDLTKFGNMMLYSYQNISNGFPEGFLKSSTVRQMWTASSKFSNSKSGCYGLGWGVADGDKSPKAFSFYRKFYASHTGGAVGASSVLLIMPTYDPFDTRNVMSDEVKVALPQGIVVSIITNMQNVGLLKLAARIANIFDRVHHDPKILGNTLGPSHRKIFSLETS